MDAFAALSSPTGAASSSADIIVPSDASLAPSSAHTHRRSASKLRDEYLSLSSTSSSTSALRSFERATDGLDARQRKAYALKRRADEARVQQLRGIFAAFDEDGDGILSPPELANALLALGVEPTSHVLARFNMAAPGGRVDLQTFIRVVMIKLESFTSTDGFMTALFHEFDPDRTGRIPLSSLLHILVEVDTPTSLDLEEVNEMLRMTGILAELQGRDAASLAGTQVDYAALVKHMMFPVPRKPTTVTAASASAAAVAAATVAAEAAQRPKARGSR